MNSTTDNTTAARKLHRVRHWTLALLGPLSWSVAFGTWVLLTVQVCSEQVKPFVLFVVAVAGAATAVALFWGVHVLHRDRARNGRSGVRQFLAGLALGGGSLFALVVALSAVPVFLLKACPS